MLLFNLKDLKQNYKIANVIEIDANHIDENWKNASLKWGKNKTYVYLERECSDLGANVSVYKPFYGDMDEKNFFCQILHSIQA